MTHLVGIAGVSALTGLLVVGLALPVVWVTTAALDETGSGLDQIATALSVEPLPQRTTLLARDGTPIATVFDQNRVNVELADLPFHMRAAMVAIEDYRFYQHGALDLRGTIRALLTNAGAGGVVQGGSSITQQLVKQTLVNQAVTDQERRAATEESYARKFQELRHAIALERSQSKDWILERYLNTVYFGGGAYGVQAAAQRYFGVDARDLDLSQSAVLAGLVKSPSAHSPLRRPAKARARRDVVVNRMAELQAIRPAKVGSVVQRGLGLDPKTTPNGCLNSRAPFFCDYVLQYLMHDRSLGGTKDERARLLRSGGLTIRTTIDLDHQAAADAAVQRHTDPTDQAIGALAVAEPGTGEVRAIAQSRPMGARREEGQTFLNYVVPTQFGASKGFQAGSTFKAFVLAAAIEQGISLSTTYATPNSMVFDQSEFANCPEAPPFAGTFTVGNEAVPSDGYENLYSGTRRSINTFYLRLEQETGVCAPFELAREMGVRLVAPEGRGGVLPERVPIFPLGVADVSPLEMAEAYATFAARGVHCDSRPVTAIEGPSGDIVGRYDRSCEEVMRPETADAVSDVLRGVLEPGGFAEAQALDQPAAGKTGNNEGLSVWFVGYTPQVAAAAMIAGANDQGTPTLLDGTIVGGVPVYGASGSAYAAPIWGAAMSDIDDDLDYQDFAFPGTVPGVGAEFPTVPADSRSDPSSGPDPGGVDAPGLTGGDR